MLKSTLAAMAAVFAISAFSPAMAAKGDPHVLLTTSAGNIELELNSQKAPISVDNFLKYVNSGFYNNTTFHRVIPGFMVQGGGFNEQMQQKQPNPPIKNEADNGLRNTRGTIAMARTADQDSATSQFFINVADNAFLDHGQRDFGYAVFGKVVKGWTWRIRSPRSRPITSARTRMCRPNRSLSSLRKCCRNPSAARVYRRARSPPA
jgi:peptidyl-prolyl cis-trans isomerase A (cyclophilin A)